MCVRICLIVATHKYFFAQSRPSIASHKEAEPRPGRRQTRDPNRRRRSRTTRQHGKASPGIRHRRNRRSMPVESSARYAGRRQHLLGIVKWGTCIEIVRAIRLATMVSSCLCRPSPYVWAKPK